jgi:outer membrane protein OmpA-like peptidoglycan-associated protein/tetratricopeptide (TPR) repeat protein
MKITCRYLILLAAATGWISSYSQQAKNPVQLGDQYFAAGEYYTAANLYGQFLNPSKKQKSVSNFPLNTKGKRAMTPVKGGSHTAILFKQAESYRLANYWQEAAKAYKEAATKDPDQYGEGLYWYAVCERSLGDYAAAEESIKQYLSAGGNSKYKEAAQKELKTLQFIRQQLSRADSVLFKIQKLYAPSGSEKGVFAPAQANGNQFLISSTERDSVQVNGVNPYHSRLFYVTLNDGKLEGMTPLSISPTDPSNNQGAATISADGKHLYFSQWKKEKGQIVSTIYHSTKKSNGWSLPVKMPSVNVNGFSSKHPFCSTDGKYLFFASDRPGGAGGFDIWYAPLKDDGSAGEPVNAGNAINTSSEEQAPFYQNSSNTLVFSSNGREGMGGYDLFTAKGSEASWATPQNIGHPVNSSRDDIYFFAPEQTSLLTNAIISSDRGSGCCLETYSVVKGPKSKRFTGIVRDCKDNSPVAGAEVVFKNAAEKKWKLMTDDEGKYVFEPGSASYENLTLTISKDQYGEKTSPFKTENTDESDLLIDQLINADLCIEKIPEPKPEEPLVIKAEDVVTVYFDFDKSLLKPAVINKLDSIYTIMTESPIVTVQISGYTDGLGSEEYNKKLSDRRARACADYLIQKGIDKNRIRFVSFGACCPVEMELINGRDNPDGRSLNRRALINVKKD